MQKNDKTNENDRANLGWSFETETSVITIANQNEDKYHKEALWTRYKSKQKQVCYLNLR